MHFPTCFSVLHVQTFTQSWTTNSDDSGMEIPFPVGSFFWCAAFAEIWTWTWFLATQLYQASGAFEHVQDFKTCTL